MLPITLFVECIKYEERMKVGDDVVYMNPSSPVTVTLRVDAQGRIEERLDCLIQLITITTGLVSFENNLARNQFFKVVDAYFSFCSNEFGN